MDKKTYTIKTAKRKVEEYVRYLKGTRHLPVREAYLYGSYAKHRAHAWSDIDVCIVSPLFAKEDGISFLWKNRRKEDIDDMIAPVGFSPEDFDSPNPSPLVAEIRKTGVKIKGSGTFDF
jgi:predicted nucleotidyltransferase